MKIKEIKTFSSGILGTNEYLIINDNNEGVLVDCGGGHSKILKYIDDNKILLTTILLTHGHFDHIFDLYKYKNVKIYISKEDYHLINNNTLNGCDLFGIYIPNIDLNNVIIYPETNELNINGLNFYIYNTPGHTRGSVVILIENYLFSGDTIFNNGYGRTDLPTGDNKSILNSLNYILNTFNDDTIIYPGHGDKTCIIEEKKYFAQLLNFINKK